MAVLYSPTEQNSPKHLVLVPASFLGTIRIIDWELVPPLLGPSSLLIPTPSAPIRPLPSVHQRPRTLLSPIRGMWEWAPPTHNRYLRSMAPPPRRTSPFPVTSRSQI